MMFLGFCQQVLIPEAVVNYASQAVAESLPWLVSADRAEARTVQITGCLKS